MLKLTDVLYTKSEYDAKPMAVITNFEVVDSDLSRGALRYQLLNST